MGRVEGLALRKQESEQYHVVAVPIKRHWGLQVSCAALCSVSSWCLIQIWLRWPLEQSQYNAPGFSGPFTPFRAFSHATEHTKTFLPLRSLEDFK